MEYDKDMKNVIQKITRKWETKRKRGKGIQESIRIESKV